LRLYRPPLDPVFGTIVRGARQSAQGSRSADRVVEAGGKPIAFWEELVLAIRARPGAPLRLAVVRNGERIAVDVVPDAASAGGVQIGRIGAAPRVPESHAERILVRVNYGAVRALRKGCAKTWRHRAVQPEDARPHADRRSVLEASFRARDDCRLRGQSAQMGWLSYVTFLALISVSLAVLNLLPIPLLDGGHLLYYAVEIIRGSPVSERAMELGQRVGLALLLLMMAFAFYNDLNRLFSG
jgi:regulator of sigma E protease